VIRRGVIAAAKIFYKELEAVLPLHHSQPC